MDKKILVNVFWMSAEKFIRLPLSFIINIYLIKHLGAEEYGSYAFYMVVIGLLMPLSSFGMDAFLVKESVGTAENSQNKIFFNGLIVRLIGSLAGFLIAVTIVLTDESELSHLGILMSFVLLIESFTIGHYRLLAKEKFFKISAIEITAFFFGFLGKGAFIFFDLPIVYLGVSYCLEFFIRSLSFLCFSDENYFKISYFFDLSVIKRYISVGKKLVVAGLLVAALTKIDQLMIYYILGDKSIGVYSASLRFIEPLLLIIVVFNEAVFPRLLHFRKAGEELYLGFVRRVLFFNICGGLLIYVVALLFAPPVIIYMLGDAFSTSADIYPILALLIPVLSLVFFLDKYLQAEGIHYLNRNRIVISFVINIPLNYIFIDGYGLEGAAVATIMSYALGLLVLVFSKQFRETFSKVVV